MMGAVTSVDSVFIGALKSSGVVVSLDMHCHGILCGLSRGMALIHSVVWTAQRALRTMPYT